jgi:hypothetical protein
MTAKKIHRKPPARQSPAFGQKPEEHLGPVDGSLSPIVDKRTYDRFIKAVSLHIYLEFEKTLKGAGIEKPELSLVGFDLKKSAMEMDMRMADYIALNARLMLERAFVDSYDFASRFTPRVMRQMAEDGSSDIYAYLEGKVQHDIMMEIRAIAMHHIPEAERFSYRHTLKVL